MAHVLWPLSNIRCTCMVKEPSHIWKLYTFLWLKGQHYLKYYINQTAPLNYRQPSFILYGSVFFTTWNITSNMVKLTLPIFFKPKEKLCVWGTITYKTSNHVRKIGLKFHFCKLSLISTVIRALCIIISPCNIQQFWESNGKKCQFWKCYVFAYYQQTSNSLKRFLKNLFKR